MSNFKIDKYEFNRGFCQEFEKVAMQPWQPGMGVLTGKPTNTSGFFGGIRGMADTLGSASTGTEGLGNIAKNEVVSGAQGSLKLGPQGNVNIDAPAALKNVGGDLLGSAWNWAKQHPIFAGLGAAGLGLGAYGLFGGGRSNQQPVVNNYFGSPANRQAEGQTFFNKG